MKNCSITILSDNIADSNLESEHGFSLLLQTPNGSLLFDAGQDRVLFHNAQKLDIDLRRIDKFVLSHGHYDHCGGIAELLRINPALKVFMHPGATVKRYSCHPDKPVKEISMPEDIRKKLALHPAVFPITAPVEILAKVWATGEVPRRKSFEDTGGPFFLDVEKETPDPIIDDLSLWVETPSGLVILLGCCHSGLVNTVEHIQKVSGANKIAGIIGGMHLLHASAERIEKTCKKLAQWRPEFIMPCHCTGEVPTKIMHSRLGDRVTQGYAGMNMSFLLN